MPAPAATRPLRAPHTAWTFPQRALAARLGDLLRPWAEILAMPPRPPEPCARMREVLLRIEGASLPGGPDVIEAQRWVP